LTHLSTRSENEARFDRGAWWLLAAVLLFAAVTTGLTLAILAAPADGWLIPYDDLNLTLDYFYGDWPTPLRAGDQVRAIEGMPLDALYQLRWGVPPPGWAEGATVTYSVERAGQRLEIPVQLHRPGGATRLRALAYTAFASPLELSWPLVALIVFWRRPRSRAARLLLLAMVSHAVVVKISWAANLASLNLLPSGLRVAYLFVTNFWSWLFWPSIILLVLSFPLRVWPLARWPRAVPLGLYGLPLVLVLTTLVTANDLPVTLALVGELAALLLALGLAVANVRRQRADPVALAQTRWVILGFGLSFGVLLAAYLTDFFFPFLEHAPAWLLDPLTLALPVCLGVAITRYHLWDIDVIIRRTLIYSTLTGVLALAYFGSVLLLQRLAQWLTGQGDSPLVVVVSTLAIAALFVPVRRRVQAIIDQRFFRRKYDAARTLAGFAVAARDEVDLDRLSVALLEVVEDTLQPAHVGLWLPGGAARGR
jgi:hypothetical protein